MCQNLTSNISQSCPHTSSIFMSFSIKLGTLNSTMKWKPEVVFCAILAENQISGFSRPRISAIRLCSATTRSADLSVDRWRFGSPSWTRNRTAMPRRTDSDHAKCLVLPPRLSSCTCFGREPLARVFYTVDIKLIYNVYVCIVSQCPLYVCCNNKNELQMTNKILHK